MRRKAQFSWRARDSRAAARRNRAMPIHRAGMLKAPVDGNPARPPGLETKFFGARRVAANFKDVEILPGKDVPVAVKKSAAKIFRQRFEAATIRSVVGECRVVFELRANEIVIAWVVQFGALVTCWGNFVHPQRFHPGVADVAGVGGAGHVAAAARHGATITRSEKLPLLQGEMRQLIDADEEEFGALILIDVALVAAISEARGGAVAPGHQVPGFVVTFVERAGHIATELQEQRRFQLGVGAAQKKRVAASDLEGMKDRFPKQSFGFARSGGASEQPVLCAR